MRPIVGAARTERLSRSLIARMNLSFGAGSHCSLSLPGASFWIYGSTEPSAWALRAVGVGLEFVALTHRVAVDRIRQKKVTGVVHRQRPEPIDRRQLTFVEVHDVLVRAAVCLDEVWPFGCRVHRILRPICAKTNRRGERPQTLTAGSSLANAFADTNAPKCAG